MPRTAEQIIQAEIHLCVSHIVSTLATNMGAVEMSEASCDLCALSEQAFELAAPVADYEEAATQAGWEELEREPEGQHVFRDTTDGQTWCAPDWQTLCHDHDIDPYDREVFEHWAISDWLADRLEAKGEKVDRDFANLTVWARTTTGQAISIDSVIVEIVADLAREYGEA